MSQTKFQFSLQPKLDQLAEEKTACQMALKKAIDAKQEQVDARDAVLKKIHELTQLLDDRPDNLSIRGTVRPAYELIAQGQSYDVWTGRIATLRDQTAVLDREIAHLASMVSIRESELSTVLSSLQSLERLKERQHAEWVKEREAALQADLDDTGISMWNRKREKSVE